MERPAVEFTENAIEVDRLIPKGLEKKAPASGLSFALHKGEILGLAGVAGNGQSELIASITGLSGVSSGTVTILGEEMTNRTPRAFIEKGVAHIPERRREMGIIEQMFVAENVALKDYRKTPFSRHTILNREEITRHAEEIVSRFNALVPDLWETECRILSGGNIQRLILGRETWREPPVIIASHPTEGLDAKAIRHTWELFLALRAKGSAILLISEDLDEVMSLSDRIGVIFEGGIVGVVEGENANREQLGHWMAGGKISAAA
jgi:simple sugar transport system ATP-binding protein